MQEKKVELELLPLWTWRFIFLFGGDYRDTELINYEAALAPKTEGGNVKGFSCYNRGNYNNTLKDSLRKSLSSLGVAILCL